MKERIWEIFLRYFILLFLGLFNLKLIYLVFTPITIYPVYFIFSLLDEGTKWIQLNQVIFFRGINVELISACIAGAAYYLLIILNLSTPMKIKRRMKSLCFLLGGFLLLNIARILTFTGIAIYGSEIFNYTHRAFWYGGSTVLVVLLWFVNVYIFKIREIPVYSDAQEIIKSARTAAT